MITTDKDIDHYEFTCDCGRTIELASNQPQGDTIPVICECFHGYNLKITSETGAYHFEMREDTRRIRDGIISIYQDIQRKMTVRQVFYQAVSRGLVPKSEQYGYNLIQRSMLEMRKCGHLPYSFVSDLSRRMVKPTTYNGLGDALDHWIQYFRIDVWKDQRDYVEIWLEKDALSGIFLEVTRKYDVPLYIARGFSSESFLHDAAMNIKAMQKPTYVYFFSDYDKAGLDLCNKVEKRLPMFGVDINFERVGLNLEQIREWNLPTRPEKSGAFSDATDLDAVHPNTLQDLISNTIEQHINPADMDKITMEEEVQRDTLKNMKYNFLRQAQ